MLSEFVDMMRDGPIRSAPAPCVGRRAVRPAGRPSASDRRRFSNAGTQLNAASPALAGSGRQVLCPRLSDDTSSRVSAASSGATTCGRPLADGARQ